MARLLSAVALSAVLLVSCGSDPPEPVPLAAFDLPDLQNPSVRHSAASLLGRPAVINVFASTCVPCERELPMIERVARELAGQVQFLGVDQLEFRRDALPFVERLGITFPVAHDEAGDLAVSMLLAGLPTTIFVDKHGQERYRSTGPITEEQLRLQLRALLR